MNVVCVSQVIDVEQPVDIAALRAAGEDDGLARTVNPADRHALEAALQVRDADPEAAVTAISMGPPRCQAALRTALAQGADRALLLWDGAFQGSDSLATARILAAAARRLGADLVLCGTRSSDGNTGQVGPQLAELLNVPCLTDVVAIEVAPDRSSLLATRRAGQGVRLVERASLPALCAVEMGANRPRYPRLRAIVQSQRAAIERWGLAELGLRPDEVGAAGSAIEVRSISPPPDTRGLTVPDAGLSGAERWQAVISGGLTERQGGPIEGTPPQLVERIVQSLEKGQHL